MSIIEQKQSKLVAARLLLINFCKDVDNRGLQEQAFWEGVDMCIKLRKEALEIKE